MTATQQCPLTFAVYDAKGNPASIDGLPVWATSDATKVALDIATDAMTAVARAVGPVTTENVQVSVQVDADLGTGVQPIIGLLDVQIVGGTATVVNISAGTPEEQPKP
jgi:hypothetical protein